MATYVLADTKQINAATLCFHLAESLNIDILIEAFPTTSGFLVDSKYLIMMATESGKAIRLAKGSITLRNKLQLATIPLREHYLGKKQDVRNYLFTKYLAHYFRKVSAQLQEDLELSNHLYKAEHVIFFGQLNALLAEQSTDKAITFLDRKAKNRRTLQVGVFQAVQEGTLMPKDLASTQHGLQLIKEEEMALSNLQKDIPKGKMIWLENYSGTAKYKTKIMHKNYVPKIIRHYLKGKNAA